MSKQKQNRCKSIKSIKRTKSTSTSTSTTTTTTTPQPCSASIPTPTVTFMRPRRPNRHHCPLDSKGNCRRKDGYCKTHQLLCLWHGLVHMTTESCWRCYGEYSHKK